PYSLKDIKVSLYILFEYAQKPSGCQPKVFSSKHFGYSRRSCDFSLLRCDFVNPSIRKYTPSFISMLSNWSTEENALDGSSSTALVSPLLTSVRRRFCASSLE